MGTVSNADGVTLPTATVNASAGGVTGVLPVGNGGTGISNTSNTSITISGNTPLRFNVPGAGANITLPASGTLISADSLVTGNLVISGQFNTTVVQGNAPIITNSNTVVANLNVSLLQGGNWAVPLALGSTTPAAGSFTTLAASGAVSGAGLTSRSYLAGLTLSTAGSSATMSIAAGECADSTNVSMMVLAAFTKTTSAWSLGSAGGAMDTGAVANSTWYHWYLIQRTDTGVVDVLFSLSAAAPTMPTNYTLKRRIGSGLTNGSAQWVAFIQDGDLFQWLVPILDVNATDPGTTAVTRTLTVPTGVNVNAQLNVMAAAGATFNAGYFSDLATTDAAASYTAAPLAQTIANTAASYGAAGIFVRTNTSAQIRSRSLNSGSGEKIMIATTGWIDRRGRDA